MLTIDYVCLTRKTVKYRNRHSSINVDRKATTNPSSCNHPSLEGSLGDLYIGAHPHSLDAIEPVECDSIPGLHSNQMHVEHGPGYKLCQQRVLNWSRSKIRTRPVPRYPGPFIMFQHGQLLFCHDRIINGLGLQMCSLSFSGSSHGPDAPFLEE